MSGSILKFSEKTANDQTSASKLSALDRKFVDPLTLKEVSTSSYCRKDSYARESEK